MYGNDIMYCSANLAKFLANDIFRMMVVSGDIVFGIACLPTICDWVNPAFFMLFSLNARNRHFSYVRKLRLGHV